MMLAIGHGFHAQILWFPAFVVLMLLTALGVGFWLSALNAEYRDVRYVVPFLTQVWMFATPVVYPTAIIPDKYWYLIALNPMAGVVEGFRWSLLGVGDGPDHKMFVSVGFSFAVFLSGVVWFRWRERTFVDHLGGQ
jgi:lipopolysaccharide transport system permease protein